MRTTRGLPTDSEKFIRDVLEIVGIDYRDLSVRTFDEVWERVAEFKWEGDE